MKIGSRLAIACFACVQLIGLVCMSTWNTAPPLLASFLWGTALIALFPGNFLSSMVVEHLFWNSGLSLQAMLFAQIPLLLVINAALWFGVTVMIQQVVMRTRRLRRSAV